jgi:hypothetical protein
MGGACSTYETEESFCTGFFAEKPKEKKSLGTFRGRWDYNIKIDPQEEGKNTDCVDLAQNRDM